MWWDNWSYILRGQELSNSSWNNDWKSNIRSRVYDVYYVNKKKHESIRFIGQELNPLVREMQTERYNWVCSRTESGQYSLVHLTFWPSSICPLWNSCTDKESIQSLWPWFSSKVDKLFPNKSIQLLCEVKNKIATTLSYITYPVVPEGGVGIMLGTNFARSYNRQVYVYWKHL